MMKLFQLHNHTNFFLSISIIVLFYIKITAEKRQQYKQPNENATQKQKVLENKKKTVQNKMKKNYNSKKCKRNASQQLKRSNSINVFV